MPPSPCSCFVDVEFYPFIFSYARHGAVPSANNCRPLARPIFTAQDFVCGPNKNLFAGQPLNIKRAFFSKLSIFTWVVSSDQEETPGPSSSGRSQGFLRAAQQSGRTQCRISREWRSFIRIVITCRLQARSSKKTQRLEVLERRVGFLWGGAVGARFTTQLGKFVVFLLSGRSKNWTKK